MSPIELDRQREQANLDREREQSAKERALADLEQAQGELGQTQGELDRERERYLALLAKLRAQGIDPDRI